MMILCWNVQGLKNARKLHSIQEFSCQNKYNVVCLLELKLKQDLHRTTTRYWPNFEVANNLSSDHFGRILVLWKSNWVTLSKTDESKQHMQFEGLITSTQS